MLKSRIPTCQLKNSEEHFTSLLPIQFLEGSRYPPIIQFTSMSMFTFLGVGLV